MPSKHRVACLVTLLFLMSPPVVAQERSGFFFGFGVGYGANSVSCDGCDIDTASGVAGFFKLGAHLTESFSVGVESNGWFGRISSEDVWNSNFSATGYFYPGAANWFLRGGIGGSRVEATFPLTAGQTFVASKWGFGATAGAGIDIPVGYVASITPVVNVVYGNYGTISAGSGLVSGVSALRLDLAVGVTFQ